MISSAYAIELLKKALEIYTPSRSEAQLANLIKQKCLDDLGFERVSIDSVGNVIATKGSGDPKILLCGHMDTVPGQIPVRIDSGYLFGRGASDAKAPLISMLLACSEFKQSGTIIFAGVVDEEGNATGIKELVKNKLSVDYAIFGEPSGINKITVAYKGRLALRLTCDVIDSAHASAPWLSKNSIEEVYEVWKMLSNEISCKYNKTDKKSESVTLSLTEISGGSSHNVTPQKCKITIDIRVPNGIKCLEVLDSLDKSIEKISQIRKAKVTYRIEDMTEPFKADHSSPIVRALSLSILDVCKIRPILLKKTGTGDMNVLGNSLNIPVVTYGPGEPHVSHSKDERVEIQSYLTSIEIYNRALFHTSRLHHNKRASSTK
ncbi:MAG: M20/M25/M40 family metallo-hydrolase [Nitrososphaeraceae archaeon]|nr:M20/M25/M40 family metallo-hydrolase [Nitrososphaeraceae archaeon]MDW0204624.1 M20/M25/M40 family metallo-hydrolase [Nitrososphaeraceae archaeon]MDW0244733.1 M20/M25/M40 family metallo-hydrolase [Nitrososphaeraceae archaeon]